MSSVPPVFCTIGAVAPAPPGPADPAAALAPPGALVIRGGYVLTMDPEAGDLPAADVHIAGGLIAAVGAGLAVPAGTPELGAAGMIVAPGLVDTHWHMWNTLLRSMSADVDSTVLTGNADMFSIMKVTQGIVNALAGDEFAMTHRQALALGTIEGARSLGLGGVTGSLTPGKRADVICVSTGEPNLGVLTDPAHLLVTAAQPANVDTVIVDGRVLKRAGALTTIDPAQAREDARRALAGVRAQAAG